VNASIRGESDRSGEAIVRGNPVLRGECEGSGDTLVRGHTIIFFFLRFFPGLWRS
jgi:hypothetical protein